MLKAMLTDRATQVRFVRFLVVGGGSALVQFAVLAAMQRWLSATLAFSVSWIVSTAVHYFANRFWALPSGRRDSGRQFGEYLFAVALSYAVNLAGFEFCRRVLGLGVMWSAFWSIPPSTVIVFALLNFRVFRATAPREH